MMCPPWCVRTDPHELEHESLWASEGGVEVRLRDFAGMAGAVRMVLTVDGEPRNFWPRTVDLRPIADMLACLGHAQLAAGLRSVHRLVDDHQRDLRRVTDVGGGEDW